MEDEDDFGDLYQDMRKSGQEKRRRNEHTSIDLLKSQGIPFKIISAAAKHYRVGDFDFWPSTGKFYNPKTKEVGRGVFHLIKKVKQNNGKS